MPDQAVVQAQGLHEVRVVGEVQVGRAADQNQPANRLQNLQAQAIRKLGGAAHQARSPAQLHRRLERVAGPQETRRQQ